LPPGSIIKNRQYSFWELHRPQVIVVTLVIVVLLLLVLFLLEVMRRLNRTRHALAQLNVNLETQVQERTLALSQTNTQLLAEIIERKQAQEDLIRSARERSEQQARLQALEAERNHQRKQQRLVRDLHDGLGATSANVGLLAERGRKEGQPDGKDAMFERISHLALETSLEVRSLMDSLETGGMGWVEVIENCRSRAALVFGPAGVRWEMAVSGIAPECELPSLAGLSLMRLLREAMNNILKHAHARSVRFDLAFAPDHCCIAVQDDGCGFNHDPARPGRGLKNMRHRLEELGGTMRLETCFCENQSIKALTPEQGRICPRYPRDPNAPNAGQSVLSPEMDYISCAQGPGVRLIFEIPLPLHLRDTPAPPSGGPS